MPLQLTLEIEREADGRFLAHVLELPGVAGQGDTREGAIVRAEVLALRALAARLEAGESLLGLSDVFQISDASERETAYLAQSETMKTRLLEAIARDRHNSLNEVEINYLKKMQIRVVLGVFGFYVFFVWMFILMDMKSEAFYLGLLALAGALSFFFVIVGSITFQAGMIWTAFQVMRYIFWSVIGFVFEKIEAKKRAR